MNLLDFGKQFLGGSLGGNPMGGFMRYALRQQQPQGQPQQGQQMPYQGALSGMQPPMQGQGQHPWAAFYGRFGRHPQMQAMMRRRFPMGFGG